MSHALTLWILAALCTLLHAPAASASPRPAVLFGVSQTLPDISLANMSLPGPVRDAYEFLAATNLAVFDINTRGELFPNHTLDYRVTNTFFDSTETLGAFLNLADPAHTAEPVPLVLGYLLSAEAVMGSRMGKILNVPVVSDNVGDSALIPSRWTSLSHPQLDVPLFGSPEYRAAPYPTFSRLTVSDQLEAEALVALFRHFGWTRYCSISTADSTGLALSEQVATTAALKGINNVLSKTVSMPALNLSVRADGFRYSVLDAQATAAIDSALLAVKATGIRVILLAAFSFDASSILQRAVALGMLGPASVFQWVGVRGWMFDESIALFMQPHVNGAVGVSVLVDKQSAQYRGFESLWQSTFQSDPRLLFNISAPHVAMARFDTVYLAAYALRDLLDVQQHCAANPFGKDYDGNISACLNSSEPQTAYTRYCCVLNQTATAYSNPKGSVLLSLIRRQKFLGITGNISLSSHGEFMGDLGYSVMRDGAISLFGRFRTSVLEREDGESLLGSAEIFGPVVFPDGTTTPPPDSPSIELVRDQAPMALIAVVNVFTGLCILYMLALIFLHSAWRHNAIIKMSSPNINDVSLFGAILALIFVMLSNSEDLISESKLDQVCVAQVWLFVPSFSLCFGALFAKTYRVHLIFNNKKLMAQHLIHDVYLFMIVGAMVLIDVVFLSLWTGINRPFVTRVLNDVSEDLIRATGRSVTQRVHLTCDSENKVAWLAIAVIYKGGVLIFGAWLAYQVRNVSVKALNDSKYIGRAIHLTVFSGCILTPIIYAVHSDRTPTVATIGFMVPLVIVGIVSVLFVPKFIAIHRDREKEYMEYTTKDCVSLSQHDSMVRNLQDVNLKLLDYLKELKTRYHLPEDLPHFDFGTRGSMRRGSEFLHAPHFGEDPNSGSRPGSPHSLGAAPRDTGPLTMARAATDGLATSPVHTPIPHMRSQSLASPPAGGYSSSLTQRARSPPTIQLPVRKVTTQPSPIPEQVGEAEFGSRPAASAQSPLGADGPKKRASYSAGQAGPPFRVWEYHSRSMQAFVPNAGPRRDSVSSTRDAHLDATTDATSAAADEPDHSSVIDVHTPSERMEDPADSNRNGPSPESTGHQRTLGHDPDYAVSPQTLTVSISQSNSSAAIHVSDLPSSNHSAFSSPQPPLSGPHSLQPAPSPESESAASPHEGDAGTPAGIPSVSGTAVAARLLHGSQSASSAPSS